MNKINSDISPLLAGTNDYQKIQREAELLQRTARGEEASFRELFALHQPSLLYFVYKITRDMGRSEEIVQDIFLKIWLTRESLTGIQNFKNYLFIISRNQSLKVLDKEIRLRNRQAEYEKEVQTGTEDKEELPYHLIDEAIYRLPQQQQTAWLLSRHEGLTYEEIGKRMDLSEKTVKRHIRLATDSIKEYLVRHNSSLLLLLVLASYL